MNKFAIITGATSGIDKAISLSLSKIATVALVGRNDEKLNKFRSEIKDNDNYAKTYTCDFRDNKALEVIKESIPDEASVMNGASVTLEQIGYKDYLESGNHKWKDLHAIITAEDDEEKRHEPRRQSVLSDFYLGSVHALAETGEFIVASNTGSQLPHIVSTSPNLIFVVSTKKIVPDLDTATERLNKYVIPLEDDHMQDLYKINTALNKLVTFYGEAPMTGRKIKFILIKEDLGL